MLTLVIPYYKKQFFRQTLESLTDQTNQRFKVIIGDDHSPESPQELIEEFSSKLDLKYIHFDNNLGGGDLAGQWSRCVQIADTEWFIILGDDDVLSSDAVEGFYQCIEQNLNLGSVLRFSTQIIDGEDKIKKNLVTYPNFQSAADFIWQRYWGNARLSLSEFVFRTDDFRQYGIRSYPKGFFSDNWLIIKYSSGRPIQNVNEGYLKIRMSGINLSDDPINEPAVREAEVLFYHDMLIEESDKFSKEQLSEFINVMVHAVKMKKMSVTEFFAISLKHLDVFETIKKLFILAKYGLFNYKIF